jgi:hypothetical protein
VAAKITTAITKLEVGLEPNVKPVGKGIHESRPDRRKHADVKPNDLYDLYAYAGP